MGCLLKACSGLNTKPFGLPTAPLKSVDFSRRVVTRAGAHVHLTAMEYRLLAALLAHRGKVMTHRELLREVWGPADTDQTHYVRVYVGQLRQKIETDPAQPQYILTEPGVGYRLRAADDS